MRNLADLFEISHHHDRIGRRFEKHHLRVWFDCCFDVQRIGSVDVIKLDVVVCENAIEETCCATVRVIGNDDVFACFDQSQGCVDGGHAGSECKSETSTFKS